MSTNEPNTSTNGPLSTPSHEFLVKLEPDSSADEDMLPEDLPFNSDQDDGGSNIWDFTDEEFKEDLDKSDVSGDDMKGPNLNDRFAMDDEFEEDIDLNKRKQIEDRLQKKIDDRFKPPEPTMKQIDDEKTLNSIFFQSIDWRKINHDFPYAIPGIKEFDVKDGVQIPELLEETDPYKFFTQFLQDEFLELVAFYTNQNAALDPRFKHPKKKPWKTVDKEDIRTFFGLLFLFGLMKKPNIPSYWSEDPLISTECMNRIMNRTQFARIKRYICFYDKTKPKPTGDSFYKIRSFQDHVLNNSKRVYVPERDLSVDESIILYTGLHRLKVYMPQKPNRYGFKAFVLSEATTGFICNMMMAEGRLKGSSEESFTKRLVLDILKEYEDKGYRVYMDRYYTSAELFMDMKRKGIGACGTSLLNRLKFEKTVLKDILDFKETDSSLFFTNDSLMMTVFYHYKRQVHMISNFHDNSVAHVEKITKLRGFDKKDVKIYAYDMPSMIREYSYKMKGVDLFNQRMSYYSTNFRSMRWYFRIIYFYMEMAMINSYLVYMKIQNKNQLRPKTHADYRIYVIKKMVNWKGPERMDPKIKINQFQRDQYHMNPQDGAKKRYEASIYDSKKLSFNGNFIDLPCEIDRAKLSGMCYYCDSSNQNGKQFKSKKTLWVCKPCKKYCCKGPCFLKHKIHLFMNNIVKMNQGTNFINTLLATHKLKLLDNGQEIYKLKEIDIKEFQMKKQAILQYKRNSLIGSSDYIEEQSEKSLTITNIEEIKQQREDVLSMNSDITHEGIPFESTMKKKRGRKPKELRDFHKEVRNINKMFPKRKGRPKGFKMIRKEESSDEDYEDIEFDKALKMSIKRKAEDELKGSGSKALFGNLKEFYGMNENDGENDGENEQIFEGIEGGGKTNENNVITSVKPKDLRDNDEINTDEEEKNNEIQRNYTKPPLINTKKLYRYDSSKNTLKVCKSKLITKEKKKQSDTINKPSIELKKRGRKSRLDKNLDFLIFDLYKSNDLRTIMKGSASKTIDFMRIFDSFPDIETEDTDFRLAKRGLFEEENQYDEGSMSSDDEKINRGIEKKKRGRPRSLNKPEAGNRVASKKKVIIEEEEEDEPIEEPEDDEWKPIRKSADVVEEEDIENTEEIKEIKMKMNKQNKIEKNKKIEQKSKKIDIIDKIDKIDKMDKMDKIDKSDKIDEINKIDKINIIEKLPSKPENSEKTDENIEEDIHDFVIELEIDNSESEKSMEVKSKTPSKENLIAKKTSKNEVVPIKKKISKKAMKPSKKAIKSTENIKKKHEIVEIEDDASVKEVSKEVEIIEEDDKNIWLEKNVNEHKISFEYDLEDSLE